MKTIVITDQTVTRLRPWMTCFVLALMTLSFAPAAPAKSARKQVDGVKNFGQVTNRYFRGGAATPAGVKNLASMGVRTIIDLRDKPSPGEPEACKQNGIRYLKFPMDGSVTPDHKSVNQILSIIQNSREPIYVHCSAGKHRAGTIAALYRMRVQGWTKTQAWAEQQSYGFGPAEEHPELYAYVYGANSSKSNLSKTKTTDDGKNKSSKSKNKTDDDDEKDRSSKKDDDDDDEKDKSSKKSDDDDDDDDDDDGDKVKSKSEKKSKKNDQAEIESEEEETEASSNAHDGAKEAPATESGTTSVIKSLSAEARYISLGEAIKRAKAEGGTGEILKVDLEWDEVRATVTWDITFSSGNEYEIDALSGKSLGSKIKGAAKLAVLSPLALNDRGLLTFQEIIRKAESASKQHVMEMELKRVKGRSETIYEVALADGKIIFYNAVTGKQVSGM